MRAKTLLLLMLGLLLVPARLPAPISEITPSPPNKEPAKNQPKEHSGGPFSGSSWTGTTREEARGYDNSSQTLTGSITVTVDADEKHITLKSGAERLTFAARANGKSLSFLDVRLRDTATRGKQMTRHEGTLALRPDNRTADFTDKMSVSDLGQRITTGTLQRSQ